MDKTWKFLLPTLCGLVIICIVKFGLLDSRQAAVPEQQPEAHPKAERPTPPQASPQAQNKPLDTNETSRLGNMFGPASVPPSPSVPAPKTRLPDPVKPPPPTPQDPLQNFIYSGYALLDERRFALMEDRRTHEGTWVKEGDTFQGYTVEHIARGTLHLSQGKTGRDLAISDRFNAVPLVKDAPITVLPDPGNLAGFRGQVNQSFYFQVTGRLTGSVWGNGTYTDDSDLGTAAVHAGILRDGQQGIVRVTVLPGYNSYDSSTRNGVTSNTYATWQGSYRVDR